MEIVATDTNSATLTLTRAELALFMNAIFHVCQEGASTPVEEWEFPTRMGGLECSEAIFLAERIRDLREQSAQN